MAEAVFRSLTVSNPLIAHVDSAGTGAYHTGDSPDPRTMSTLENNGIGDYKHGARQIRSSDFVEFDYVLTMDGDNLRDVERARQRAWRNGGQDGQGQGKGRVMLFGDFGGRRGEEVVDPYYGARNGFDVAYKQMVRFSTGFVKQVLGEEKKMS